MGRKICCVSLGTFLVIVCLAFLFAMFAFFAYADSLSPFGIHVLDEGRSEDCVSSKVITVWYQIGSDKPLVGKKLTFTLREPYSKTIYSTTDAILGENGYIKIDLPKPDCKRGSVELLITLEGTKLRHIDRFYLQ